MTETPPDIPDPSRDSFWAVLGVFLRLGATSFGGPVAHLGLFRREFVKRRRWLDDQDYAGLVTLCQTLPGPSSSQVALLVGRSRGGLAQAFAAWLGFTLPGALLMVACAALVGSSTPEAGWLLGLQTFAVAVVALAVWSMGRTLCPDSPRLAIALVATLVCRLVPGGLGQSLAILGGSALGHFLSQRIASASLKSRDPGMPSSAGSRRVGIAMMFACALLLALPGSIGPDGWPLWTLASGTYQSGALVFGGGHVVLPLLQAQVADPLGVPSSTFLAGYGIVQGLPGPLFNFAAFLGYAVAGGWGALLATVAIFLPGSLLALGALPFWSRLQGHPEVRRLLPGVNAAVVGVLLAAFLDPVCTHGLRGPADVALAAGCFAVLVLGKVPPWILAIACAGAGMLLH
jgi:chromate transporter